MPETTPLIKAALNLRGGAGFDVYLYSYFILSLFLSFVNTIFTHSKYRLHLIYAEIAGTKVPAILAYLIILFYN